MGALTRVLDWWTSTPAERVEPLEGTSISLFNTIIPSWWSDQGLSSSGLPLWSPLLSERVWVASRCQQMNAQQIASMPLEFNGAGDVPAWVSSPDPVGFPNGIGDAIHAMVSQMYGWGFSCLYVTDRYADGYPRTWTVLDSSRLSIFEDEGVKRYKLGEMPLNPANVVQIDRNPGCGLHGSSALKAYAQVAWSLLAAGNQSLTVSQGGTPKFYLASSRKLTKDQAEDLQTQWMDATQRRNGAPPVVPPEIVPKEMSFDPADMALLETQEFDARAIATAYGVPSVLLNMSLQGGMTYQNPAALGEMWWRFELRPTATRIANALSAQLLPRGQWVSFDAEDTFAPLTAESTIDDEQAAQPPMTAKASPGAGRLTAIGGMG